VGGGAGFDRLLKIVCPTKVCKTYNTRPHLRPHVLHTFNDAKGDKGGKREKVCKTYNTPSSGRTNVLHTLLCFQKKRATGVARLESKN
jgi:hypothetical protein